MSMNKQGRVVKRPRWQSDIVNCITTRLLLAEIMMILVWSACCPYVPDPRRRCTYNVQKERGRIVELGDELSYVTAVLGRCRLPSSRYTREQPIRQIEITTLQSKEDLGERG